MRFATYEEELFIYRYAEVRDRFSLKDFCIHMLSPEYRERNFTPNDTLGLAVKILEEIDEADFYEALEDTLSV